MVVKVVTMLGCDVTFQAATTDAVVAAAMTTFELACSWEVVGIIGAVLLAAGAVYVLGVCAGLLPAGLEAELIRRVGVLGSTQLDTTVGPNWTRLG